jgi:hypothetical protein
LIGSRFFLFFISFIFHPMGIQFIVFALKLLFSDTGSINIEFPTVLSFSNLRVFYIDYSAASLKYMSTFANDWITPEVKDFHVYIYAFIYVYKFYKDIFYVHVQMHVFTFMSECY